VRKIHKKNIKPFVLLSGLLLSSGLHAAQLGKVEVLSSADEPFLAKIEIQSLKPQERKGLVAKLASPEAFKAARLTMDPRLANLKFEIKVGAAADSAVIQVSSEKPVGQNFLDALVELSWSGGRVAREYTFTPAESKRPAEKTEPTPEIRAPQTQAQQAPPQAPPRQIESAPPRETNDSGMQYLKPTGNTGTQTVRKGQTLSGLASKLAGNGVSLNQAMAAIYEANKDAFAKNSVHQLRAGARLVIPNKAELRAKTDKEALLVLAKSDDREVYSRYARQLGLFSVTDQSNSSAPTTQAQGKVESATRVPASVANGADQLKIAPSNTQSSKVDAAAEELTAKNKALAEASERIALLEKNVSDLQKLLDMQKDMVDPNKPAQGGAETPAPAAEQSDQEEEGSAKLIDAHSEALSKAEDKAEAKEEEVKEEKPEAPPKEEGGSLLPWLLGGAGAAVLSVIGLLVWRARSKKKEGDSFIVQEPSFDQVLPEDDVKSAVPQENASVKPLDTVSNDDFDLDQLLVAHGEDKPQEPVTLDVAPVFEEESPALEVVEAPSAVENVETTVQGVELEFPDEPASEPSNSILDDLDMLSKGAESAQAEIQAMREQLKPDTEELAEEAEAEDEPEVNLDLDVPEPKAEPIDEAVWQEVATKLDLAGAYVEIGDADGAKELLTEIVKKGDAEQVSKAKALLETLG
jgi:pilus assembly protein FimV